MVELVELGVRHSRRNQSQVRVQAYDFIKHDTVVPPHRTDVWEKGVVFSIGMYVCEFNFMVLWLQRGDDKRNGDIVPPIPFLMKPSAMSLYMRRKMGKGCVMKHARAPAVLLSVADLPRPEGNRILLFDTFI